MLQILLHNNDILRLVQIQKMMIKELNSDGEVYIQNYPLWIDADILGNDKDLSGELSKEELKIITKKIKSLKIEKPFYNAQKKSFYSTVTFFTADNKELTSTLLILKKYKGKKNPPEKDNAWSSGFPMDIKTFRIGLSAVNQFSKKGFLYSIKDFVWSAFKN